MAEGTTAPQDAVPVQPGNKEAAADDVKSAEGEETVSKGEEQGKSVAQVEDVPESEESREKREQEELAKRAEAAKAAEERAAMIAAREEEEKRIAAKVQETLEIVSLSVFPIFVQTPSGEKITLQVTQGDSISELRMYLREHPTTCFHTNYSLELNNQTLHEFQFLQNQGEGQPDAEGQVQMENQQEALTAENTESAVAEEADSEAAVVVPEGQEQQLEAAPQITPNCLLRMVPILYSKQSSMDHIGNVVDVLTRDSAEEKKGSFFTREFLAGKSPLAEDSEKKSEQAEEGKEKEGKKEESDVSSDLSRLTLDSMPSKLSEFAVAQSGSGNGLLLHSLNVSGWNPPSPHRELMGDYFYLDVTSVENKSFTITCNMNGFFVNSSTDNSFNPLPNSRWKLCYLLVDLLRLISPHFTSTATATLAAFPVRHPFEVVDVPFPVHDWAVAENAPTYRRLSCQGIRPRSETKQRAVDSFSFQMRDWNDDFQTVREMPKLTMQDKIIRDHALFRLQSEFVQEATTGVEMILAGSLAPINPLDPFRNQMFIRNKVFYCVLSDSDLYKDIGGEETAHITASNDLKGIAVFNSADVDEINTVATCVIDYLGYRVTAQAIVPGILQVHHAKVVYGATDPQEEIKCDPEFHELMCTLADRLLIRVHKLKQQDGSVIDFAAPADMKGIIGTDQRKYVLDLAHPFPRDPNFPEKKHHAYILRAELLANYYQHVTEKKKQAEAKVEENKTDVEVEGDSKAEGQLKDNAAEVEKATKKEEKNEVEKVGNSISTEDEPRFNPNLGISDVLGDSEEVLEADRELVKKVGEYLTETIIPGIVDEWKGFPFALTDGTSLRDGMRARGINMRYLGRVLSLCDTANLKHPQRVCLRELLVRSMKHVFRKYLRSLHEQSADGKHIVAYACSRFLNCVFGLRKWSVGEGKDEGKKVDGEGSAQKPKKKKNKKRSTASKNDPFVLARNAGCKCASCSANHNSLWDEVRARASDHFAYDLNMEEKQSWIDLTLLRGFCLSVGLQIAARDYDFSQVSPFEVHDVIGIRPLVKQVQPKSLDAMELVEAARITLEQGRIDHSLELLSDALHVVHHVYGPLNAQTAACYALMAALMHYAGDDKRALLNQKLALLIRERVLGLDHDETAHSYASLGLFYLNMAQVDKAIEYFKRAFLLSRLSSGDCAPAEVNLCTNIAMILQDAKQFEAALAFITHARDTIVKLGAQESIVEADTLHGMAVLNGILERVDEARTLQQQCIGTLTKLVGEEDPRTAQAKKWLTQLNRVVEARERNAAIAASAAASAAEGGTPQNREQLQLTEAQFRELLRILQAQQAAKAGEGSNDGAEKAAAAAEGEGGSGSTQEGAEGSEEKKVMYVDREALVAALAERERSSLRGFLNRPPTAAAPSVAQAKATTGPQVTSSTERKKVPGPSVKANVTITQGTGKKEMSPEEIDKLVADIEGNGTSGGKKKKNQRKKAKRSS